MLFVYMSTKWATSAVTEETNLLLHSSVNEYDTEPEFDDDDFDEDEDLDDGDDDITDDEDDSDEDDQDEDDDWEDEEDEEDDNWADKKDQKKPTKDYRKLYNITETKLRKLQAATQQVKPKDGESELSETDLAKLREKYDEDDIKIIQKMIRQEAKAIVESTKSNSLSQREENIFLKKHPEIEESDLKYVKYMQKEFWYSLEKAYSIAFGKNKDSGWKKKSTSVTTFDWDKRSDKGWKSNKWGNDDAAAMRDMANIYGAK